MKTRKLLRTIHNITHVKETDNFSELILVTVFSNDLFLKENGIMTIVFSALICCIS